MKKNVAILSGGFSREFDVSIKSGDVVFQNIDRNKYTPFKIVIQKESWLYHSSDGEKIAVNKEDFSIEIGKNRINFDVIIIMIHGSPGEDGILQSYFDLLVLFLRLIVLIHIFIRDSHNILLHLHVHAIGSWNARQEMLSQIPSSAPTRLGML